MTWDANLDTGARYTNSLVHARGMVKLAMELIFDLPDDYPIGRVMSMDGEEVQVITAGYALGSLIQGEGDPRLIVNMIYETGAIRPWAQPEEEGTL